LWIVQKIIFFWKPVMSDEAKLHAPISAIQRGDAAAIDPQWTVCQMRVRRRNRRHCEAGDDEVQAETHRT